MYFLAYFILWFLLFICVICFSLVDAPRLRFYPYMPRWCNDMFFPESCSEPTKSSPNSYWFWCGLVGTRNPWKCNILGPICYINSGVSQLLPTELCWKPLRYRWNHIIFNHQILPTFRDLYLNFRELSWRIFKKKYVEQNIVILEDNEYPGKSEHGPWTSKGGE